jgi:hypothetical protein
VSDRRVWRGLDGGARGKLGIRQSIRLQTRESLV